MCGLDEWEHLHQGSFAHVSHLACVEKLQERFEYAQASGHDKWVALKQAEAELAALRQSRTDILDSAWNAANGRALQAEAELAFKDDMLERSEAELVKAEAENKRLRCCGNCKHAELEKHDSGSGYFTFTDVRLECDDYFPGQEWCESSGWVKDEFPVTTLGSRCHFTPDRWTAREEASDG